MTVLYIVLGILALLVIAGIISYNRFVSQRNLIRNAWANIDTELRRRYDLIPNLVETVKGYASHEREVFEEVSRARAGAMSATGSPAAQAQAEGPLIQALGRLFAVAEAYPQLRATENFQQLQAELANTEDRLQTARRFYNNNVQDYNRRVQAFPSTIMARMFGFKEEEFFHVDEALRQAGAPRVEFGAEAGAGAAPAVGFMGPGPGGGAAQTPGGAGGGPPGMGSAGGGGGGAPAGPPPGGGYSG
jgi:LemA protein